LTEWHRHIYQDSTIGGAHPEDYFDRHLAKVGADSLWVATIGSETIGLVGLIVDGEEAAIEPLVVSKPYRNKGVGKRLVETVIAHARERGIKFLNVEPVARNTKAIKFFHSQVFKNIGHEQLFIDFSNHHWKNGLKLFDCKFNF